VSPGARSRNFHEAALFSRDDSRASILDESLTELFIRVNRTTARDVASATFPLGKKLQLEYQDVTTGSGGLYEYSCQLKKPCHPN